MTPEQVDGYRTAGDRLGAVADWYINVIATYGVWTVLAVQVAAVLAVYCVAWVLIDRGEQRRRTRRDRTRAWRQLCDDPPAEQQQPGSDSGLLLDCIAVFGDCEELDRLRAAINDARKEKP